MAMEFGNKCFIFKINAVPIAAEYTLMAFGWFQLSNPLK